MPFPTSKNIFKVQSTLAIHQGALGDFILALPAFETLRKAFPKARSVILGYPRILELAENRFYAEEILSIDQRGMATFFVRKGSLDLALSQFFETFDLIIVFGRNGEGALTRNLKRVCQGQILHVNSFPRWDEKVHLTDHLLSELCRYGFSIIEKLPKLFLNESDRIWGEDFWRREGLTAEDRSRVMVLHPGSGSKKKVWPWERFVDLAGYLQKRLGSRILIVLGPAEGEEVPKALERMEGPSPILAKGLSLVRLASVMEGCRLFIGNDSGISHMAAALGLPTIAIFGPTDTYVCSARGEKVLIIRSKIPCSPCPQERFFQCKDFPCLKGIEMEEVLKGLNKMGVEV